MHPNAIKIYLSGLHPLKNAPKLEIKYNQIKIFYFSGTGNAKKVTGWLNDVAKIRGYKPEVFEIAKTNVHEVTSGANSLIGFVSPTHGFNFPPLVLKFILGFPRSKGRNSVFLINTRAGMKLSKIFLPGLSGIAQLLAVLILIFKGYKIVGMRPIDLPSNWISLHPGIKATVVESMFGKCKRQAEAFLTKILDGKRNYRSLYDIIQDLLISPVAFGYYFVGRFMLAKTFYADKSCDNCGLCIRQCPVKAIHLVHNKPFWSYRCESCMKCMNSCANKSIQTAHGYIIGVTVLFYSVLLTSIYAFFNHESLSIITGDAFHSRLIRFAFEAILLFIILVLSYRIVHFLRKFRFFDYIIYYTSFTRFRFWRRYKAPAKA